MYEDCDANGDGMLTEDEFTDEFSKHFPEVKKLNFWQRRQAMRTARKAERKKKKEVAKAAKEKAADAAENDASLVESNLKLLKRRVDERKLADERKAATVKEEEE